MVYLDLDYQIFINLDARKEFGFGTIIYHLKKNLAIGKYPAIKALELILFLSQLFYLAETQYWPTKLGLVDIDEVFQKIRHMIKSFKNPTLIFIDHGMVLGIAR